MQVSSFCFRSISSCVEALTHKKEPHEGQISSLIMRIVGLISTIAFVPLLSVIGGGAWAIEKTVKHFKGTETVKAEKIKIEQFLLTSKFSELLSKFHGDQVKVRVTKCTLFLLALAKPEEKQYIIQSLDKIEFSENESICKVKVMTAFLEIVKKIKCDSILNALEITVEGINRLNLVRFFQTQTKHLESINKQGLSSIHIVKGNERNDLVTVVHTLNPKPEEFTQKRLMDTLNPPLSQQLIIDYWEGVIQNHSRVEDSNETIPLNQLDFYEMPRLESFMTLT